MEIDKVAALKVNRSACTIIVGLIAAVIVTGGVVRLMKRASPDLPISPSPHLPVLRPPSGGELVLIPSGEFRMGQERGRADEAPHVVSVASFYIDRDLVTQ